jgi:protein SCO1
MSSRPRAGPRTPATWLIVGAVALLAGAVSAAVILAGSSSSPAPGAAVDSSKIAVSGPYGTAIHARVPENLLRLALTDQFGRKVSLASWPGKTVLLVPFLSLCGDVCPLTTGNLLQIERSLRADHAASQVQIVELSVDPRRDIPARLAAYAKLTHASWELVTARPTELAALAKFFHFTYEKVREDQPPSIDWWTGKPLTYDVQHSDDYFVIDPSGVERVLNNATPDFHGHLNPKLYRFLSAEGRQNLRNPQEPSWTPANVMAALRLVQATRPGPEFTPVQQLIARGATLFIADGCSSCHSISGGGASAGPSFAGLNQAPVRLANGKRVWVDERFLSEALRHPRSHRVQGYPLAPMLAVVRRLNLRDRPADVSALAAFLQSSGSKGG